MQIISEERLGALLSARPGIPRVVAGGNFATPWRVLAALDDRPTIRRRAVVALAAFDGDTVAAALRRAAGDRDWQVREVAEILLDE